MRADARIAAAGRRLDYDNLGQPTGRPGEDVEREEFRAGFKSVDRAIKDAESIVRRPGSTADVAFRTYHSADVELAGLLLDEQLLERVPEVLWLGRSYLYPDNPQRLAFEHRWDPVRSCEEEVRLAAQRAARLAPVEPEDRALFTATLRAAYLLQDLARNRVRQLRNLMAAAVVGGVLLLGTLSVIGAHSPVSIPMCVPAPDSSPTASPAPGAATTTATATATVTAREPEEAPPKVAAQSPAAPHREPGEPESVQPGHEEDTEPPQVCAAGSDHPTSPDVALIALFGAAGGALAAAHVLTTQRIEAGTYRLWAWQTLVKIVFGGLTAVLGIVFLQTHLAPAILLDHDQAVLLAYSVVFGYSQQLLTRWMDRVASKAESEVSPTTPAQPPRLERTHGNPDEAG